MFVLRTSFVRRVVDPVSFADAVDCQRCLQIILQVSKYCLKSVTILLQKYSTSVYPPNNVMV